MTDTAAWLGIPLPYTADAIHAAALALLAGNTAGLRITLSRGASGRGLAPTHTATPTLVLAPFALPAAPAPARITRSPWPMVAENPVLRHKLTSYAERMAGYRQAVDTGFDETLFLNTSGELTSAAAANLFLVRGGTLLTPPVASGLLPGITRQSVLACAARANIPVLEQSLHLADLQEADAVFLTNSRIGIWPVAAFEDRTYPTDQNIMMRLDCLYRALLHGSTE
jgi:branched-subunit amino acid aminotransferase/4-amino-4-deoxychorismate lyase